ncbi:nuclear transport factor 2 family protein [Govanella unica]|uniref:DUF4440 domain-containing protein n=1 Tax=Govanella unica TaxID=2975056 RepID=A0A9X3TWD8_9PROT|nr:DUF4440 domain-containing protein [Govania unica]MDA5192929.1 DUF4440 domain-containing protein [Govania unica]
MTDHYAADIKAIEALIDTMFRSITWSPQAAPDWDGFAAPCLDEALLIPASRPAKPTTVQPFVAMMQKQRDDGNLVDFEEHTIGHHVRVFGNTAIAMSSFATRINKGDERRGVNAFMLVKTEDRWRIAAMCWDNESADHALPADLA